MGCLQVAAAALPHVAVVVYDWKNSTLQEIVKNIKRCVGLSKLVSLAVIAPGSTPGCLGEMDGVPNYGKSKWNSLFFGQRF